MRRTALITQAHTHDQANCQWDDVSARSNPLEEQIDPSALTQGIETSSKFETSQNPKGRFLVDSPNNN